MKKLAYYLNLALSVLGAFALRAILSAALLLIVFQVFIMVGKPLALTQNAQIGCGLLVLVLATLSTLDSYFLPKNTQA